LGLQNRLEKNCIMRTYSMHGRDEKCVQKFGWNPSMKETTRDNWA